VSMKTFRKAVAALFAFVGVLFLWVGVAIAIGPRKSIRVVDGLGTCLGKHT